MAYSPVYTSDNSPIVTADGSQVVAFVDSTFEVTCPANIEIITPTGQSVAVTWLPPTASGEGAPYVISVDPPSGTVFSLGSTTVNVEALNSDGIYALCSFTVTLSDTLPAGCIDPISNGATANPSSCSTGLSNGFNV